MAGKSGRSGNKNIHRIDEALNALWDKLGLSEQAELFETLGQWEEIAGEKIAAKTKPLYVKNRILYVKSDGAAWMHEFQYSKGDIIRKLNERLGRPLIKDIRFSN